MRWGIRYQLLVPLGLLLAGIAGISAATATSSAETARRQTAARIDSIARTLADGRFPLGGHVLEQMRGLSGAEYLLTTADGERTSTLPEVTGDPPDAGQETARVGPRFAVGGQNYLCRQVRLRPPHPNAGATLTILYPEARLDEAVRQAVWPSKVIGLGSGLAAAGLTLAVGGRLVRRLRDLERRTRQIAAGDFGPMPLPRPDDELRDLARSVNEMADKLAQLQDAVRRAERMRLLGQLSSGLAHQLRNGVAGARLAVQLHTRDCAGGDAEALDVALRQLNRVADDLQRFLDLGRDGEAKPQRCSLTELIDEAVRLLRPQCRHARTDLHWSPPESPAIVTGDRGQLGHLILNVLTNAAEAAGPGGRVEVRMRNAVCGARDGELTDADPTWFVVEVTDSGPGPPASLGDRLFEPFVTGKPEGIGLGLAVAKQAAESHGGRIEWQRADGQTVFRIELPGLAEGEG